MSTIDLIVLGLIKQKPQGAYDIQKELEYRNISRWIKVSTPSIYKKVIQLEEKGYINSSITKLGKMPEKTIYHLTAHGESYFLTLMEHISEKAVHIFLDLNAVIINLESVPLSVGQVCLNQIEDNILSLKDTISESMMAKPHLPITGASVLEQQLALAVTLQQWIEQLKLQY